MRRACQGTLVLMCVCAILGCEEPPTNSPSAVREALAQSASLGASRAGERFHATNALEDPGPVLTGVEALEESAARNTADISNEGEAPETPAPSTPWGPAPDLTAEEARTMAEHLADAPTYRPGEDPCEQAWQSLERATRPAPGSGPAEPLAPPSRARFFEQCHAMPESLQRCLSTSYAREHMEECLGVAEAPPGAPTNPPDSAPAGTATDPSPVGGNDATNSAEGD